MQRPLDNCVAKTPKTPDIGLPVCCKEPIHLMSVLRSDRTHPAVRPASERLEQLYNLYMPELFVYVILPCLG